MNTHNTQKGFALFIALVITGIILTASVAIVDIAVKELTLSSGDRESQQAFYAADAALECARYGDYKGDPLTGASVFYESGTLNCDGLTDFVTKNPIPNLTTSPVVATDPILGKETLTSNFSMQFSIDSVKTCADVTVKKTILEGTYNDPIGIHTDIDSRGYNTCTIGFSRRVERAIHLDY